MKMNIPSEDMHYFNAISVDDIGEVFELQGRIFRGILPKSESIVRGYFDSGFLNEIVNDKLFPETWITDYTNDRYCLILEHQKVWPNLSDAEWSFNMLKDAALMVIKIAIIAKRYGYDMKDCHSKNVLFHNNHPMFIDLGTFVPRKKGNNGWVAYSELKRCYMYVLEMWCAGCCKMAKQQQSIALINIEEMYYFKFPHFLLNRKALQLYLKIKNILIGVACKSYDAIYEKRKFVKSQYLCKKIIDLIKPFECQKLSCLYKRVNKINISKDYTDFMAEGAAIDIPNSITEELIKFRTALVLNTSTNHFAEELAKMPNWQNILQVDTDEKKGNGSYIYNKEHFKEKSKITNAVYDFCYPHVRWIEYKLPEQRMKSDLFVLNNPKEIAEDVNRAISLVFKVASYYKPKMLLVVEPLSQQIVLSKDFDKYFLEYKVIKQTSYKYLFLILK